jgi:hypothetical protein
MVSSKQISRNMMEVSGSCSSSWLHSVLLYSVQLQQQLAA